MASIYTNLRTERHYRAATGLSEEVMQKLDDVLHVCAGLWNLTRGFTVNIT